MKSPVSAQFLRFVIANTLAALVNIATRLVTSLAMLDDGAVIAGFVAGLSTSYLLCRGFVFRSIRRSDLSEIFRFILINIIALALTWAAYKASLQWLLGVSHRLMPDPQIQTLAHAIGVASPVLFSFAAQKTFTFRQKLG